MKIHLFKAGETLVMSYAAWDTDVAKFYCIQSDISISNELSQVNLKFLWHGGVEDKEQQGMQAEGERTGRWERSLPLKNVGLLSNIWTVVPKFNSGLYCSLSFSLSPSLQLVVLSNLKKSEEGLTAVSRRDGVMCVLFLNHRGSTEQL